MKSCHKSKQGYFSRSEQVVRISLDIDPTRLWTQLEMEGFYFSKYGGIRLRQFSCIDVHLRGKGIHRVFVMTNCTLYKIVWFIVYKQLILSVNDISSVNMPFRCWMSPGRWLEDFTTNGWRVSQHELNLNSRRSPWGENPTSLHCYSALTAWSPLP